MPKIIEVDPDPQPDPYRSDSFKEFLTKYLPDGILETRPLLGKPQKWWHLTGQEEGVAIVGGRIFIAFVTNKEPNTVVVDGMHKHLVVVLAEVCEEHNPELTVTVEVRHSAK